MAQATAREAHRAWQRGQASSKRGRWAQAEREFLRAARLQPNEAVFHLNVARTQLHLGRLDDALINAKRALGADPTSEVAMALAVHCLVSTGRHGEAATLMAGADPAMPRGVDYWFHYAKCIEYQGRPLEAIHAYMQALSVRLDHVPTHIRLGHCFMALDQKEEAAQCFRTAIALGAGRDELHLRGLLAFREREVCRWSDLQGDLDALRQGLAQLAADDDRPVTAFAHLSFWDDPALHLRGARSFANYVARDVTPLPPATMAPLPWRRLRVGYVSSDICQHATLILLAGVLEAHDRNRFEVTVYSHSRKDDSALRERVVRSVEHVVEIGELDPRQAAQRMRDDGIDVLIDLKGYTRDSRPAIFAYRPAPVQVSFLGYPGSTGAPWIDYIVGDPVVTPLEHAACYTEKIAQMPVCYQPNDSHRPLPQPLPRAQCGLPEDAVVLCAFNQPYKITPETLVLWAEILRRVPNSVLWLLEWNEQVRKNVEPKMQALGIDLQRIIWAPPVAYEAHIARLRNADLFLDTFPCNAHTTASDALWAGVPVVTRVGESFAARVAASLNHAVGLDECICMDAPAYLERAVALATDPTGREALRQRLVDARSVSALFDSRRYAGDFERLLLQMAERAAAGLPPAHLLA
ncbi:hypothetical protein MOJ79_17590 [Calidifontimicrobium sp. SYSU G02091]|uniref:O-linked N-acetylglucosamine transferase, SPINDLY family protein n=1 Tax=Calidifontimicrobium sp. SYSU G02091 TaxID=2926421 RepID=UPI001F537DFF|nr:BTAD domain-containing putative transcriptional regulator [Calidifontimicrobium sp. SYSU G02091]MCI1193649.1 hypothetical protein [Calidifontimicrobium sp. SYSU G02091]